MTTLLRYFSLGALLIQAGCATASGGGEAIPISRILPTANEVRSDTGPRLAPWARFTTWEERYRGGIGRNEPQAIYDSEYVGPAALVYPPSTRPAAAWGLVQLGDDFRQSGDPGGAARAYWASLTLLSRTFASRSEKERIRSAAFRGLASIARERGQAQWSELLDLSAKFADAYLTSPQAVQEDSAFDKEVSKWRRLALQHEKAEADIEQKQTLAGLALYLNQSSQANTMKQGDLAGAIALTQQQLAEQDQLKQHFEAERQQLRGLQRRSTGQAEAFKSAVANDATEVEAGNSFFSDEVLYYLATATDDTPYRALLWAFAKGKPALLQVLNEHRAKSEEDMTTIAMAARDHELAVIRAERSGLLPTSAASGADSSPLSRTSKQPQD